MPRPGEVVRITVHASVQFIAVPAFNFRIIGHHTLGSTPDGWIWLEGYQLDARGEAVERRTILVQPAGLISATGAPVPSPPVRRPVNRGPIAIPAQRTPNSTGTTARSTT